MTDDKLKSIEEYARTLPNPIFALDVEQLVAEVRQLRAALHGAADVMRAEKFREVCLRAGISDADAKSLFLGAGIERQS